ncbi:MAG: NAD-dependent epimerase/dehydratase family protein [Saprospiraceae bacterium]|nr:NAD-dependent epimerase/dehydratase family protein [Saprospiraceae bacterium]
MSKILVTGGTGFLGSYLLRYLVQAGKTVRAIKRPTSSMNLVQDIADKIEWLEGDVLDVFSLDAAMQGIEQIYHCAAMVSFDPREAEMMKKSMSMERKTL